MPGQSGGDANREKVKRTTSKNVPAGLNKSGMGLTGSMTSGTNSAYKVRNTPKGPIKEIRSRPGSPYYGVTQPTGTGKNIAGIYEQSKDGKRIFVTVPEPYNDRRTNVGGTQSNVKPVVGQYAGQSRPAPKKALAAKLATAAKPAPKPKIKIRPYT